MYKYRYHGVGQNNQLICWSLKLLLLFFLCFILFGPQCCFVSVWVSVNINAIKGDVLYISVYFLITDFFPSHFVLLYLLTDKCTFNLVLLAASSYSMMHPVILFILSHCDGLQIVSLHPLVPQTMLWWRSSLVILAKTCPGIALGYSRRIFLPLLS